MAIEMICPVNRWGHKNANILLAKTTELIKLLLENSVGVSEHLNHQKELDCQLHKIASAEEKIQVLKDYEIPKKEKA